MISTTIILNLLIWIAESGDQDKERGIHAILSFAFNLFDEPIIPCLWNV